ncbi:MAG TPA: hypothetical protein VGF56_12240 [Rhizomicrobium sp.]
MTRQAKARRAKVAAPRKSGKSASIAELRHAMFLLVDAMAEQLRIATQLTFVLCMIDPRATDESEAVVYQVCWRKGKSKNNPPSLASRV